VLNKYLDQKKTKKTTQTNKEKTKQNVKNKTKIIIHTDFPGYSKCGKKYIVTFFPVTFFSAETTHAYDIILNTDTISILIPYSE
jgi:exopolysaccharide biosynthesis predicted pyruvyltransferase EpsI